MVICSFLTSVIFTPGTAHIKFEILSAISVMFTLHMSKQMACATSNEPMTKISLIRAFVNEKLCSDSLDSG